MEPGSRTLTIEMDKNGEGTYVGTYHPYFGNALVLGHMELHTCFVEFKLYNQAIEE